MRVLVPGEPVPKGRPRRGRNGNWYTPPTTREYEERVAWHARAVGHGFGRLAVSVTVHFYLSGNRKGDGDNYLKAVMDGLQKGGVIDDDATVVDGRFVLHFMADVPRTVALVYPWPNENDTRVYCDGVLIAVARDENERLVCLGCGQDVTDWAIVDTGVAA